MTPLGYTVEGPMQGSFPKLIKEEQYGAKTGGYQ